ncbi:MAG: glutathione S-transferase family protein [Rhodospirillales bacterium]|mgnify:CR=1 FL=1|jgi:putative glutathione S-transferase|nr:glutathione S-transferase family protein [Rhodospirillales bacterium]MDP6773577.1 glutathione S-transferase family protein [Rhodospirillales bacterium]
MLIDGKWSGKWHPFQSKDAKGRFVRQDSQFRNWITPDGAPGPSGQGGFQAEPGRYHIYASLNCPWASRTLLVRKLKNLENIITLTVVAPFTTDEGWQFGGFPGCAEDEVNGAAHLHEVYTTADPRYTGRATVPVLWDKRRGTIVNNESSEIIRMLNRAFAGLGDDGLDLYPDGLAGDIDDLNAKVYEKLNNGVYRAGFAATQEAYDEAVAAVFAMLDELEQRLSDGRRLLMGEQPTEADVRLFVTLVRFDAAYHGLFKCNLRRLADYPNLTAYVERMMGLPGASDTVAVEHIKAGYYSIRALNPSGIIPAGPAEIFEPPTSA